MISVIYFAEYNFCCSLTAHGVVGEPDPPLDPKHDLISADDCKSYMAFRIAILTLNWIIVKGECSTSCVVNTR